MATAFTTKIDIPLILGRLVPLAEYHWKGNGYGVYADIGEWRTPAIQKPTEAAVYAEWDAYLIEKAATDTNAATDATKITNARIRAKAIPSWSTWDEPTALAWINGKFDATTINNIGSLAQAKPVMADMATTITALVKMVIALRDRQWPDLDRT